MIYIRHTCFVVISDISCSKNDLDLDVVLVEQETLHQLLQLKVILVEHLKMVHLLQQEQVVAEQELQEEMLQHLLETHLQVELV